MTAGWRPVPLTFATDLQAGGRWTSLRGGGREWCWAHAHPEVRRARHRVRPGDDFVDAGGVEECLPTVRGRPDHGDAWSRPWQGASADASVDLPGVGRLRRTVGSTGDLEIGYELRGEPGTRFLHAVHALLDLGPGARLAIAGTPMMRLLDDGPGPAEQPWPSGLDRLGPDDGTARCALLPGCSAVTVVDGDDALRLEWEADRPELCSLLLWRNLGGWPVPGPYRSIGVEPLVGRAADLAEAGPDDAATLDVRGRFGWRLRVTALRR